MMVSMLYAEVIVKQRTQVEELTYAVPATMVPYVRSGSLVVAPLRRRFVKGVVVGLRRNISKSLRHKIKDLHAIERDSQLTGPEIVVLRQLADHYGASLAEVAYHALDRRFSYVEKTVKAYTFTPIFIQSSLQIRLSAYCRLIKENPGRSFLCVFAQKSFAEAFIEAVSRLGVRAIFDDKTVRFQKTTQKILSSRAQLVVVGTSRSIFFPLQAGDGLIIDQPSHVGLKQQQRPYMRVKTIGMVRSSCESLRLIFGDDLVEVADINRFQDGQWRLVAKAPSSARVTVASRLRSPTFLLPHLVSLLTNVTRQDGRALVIVLARGWATAFICQTCGYLFQCPECDRTLAVDRKELVCRYDGRRYPKPIRCWECRGEDLREVGEGTARIAAELRRLIPDRSITELTSDRPNLPARGIIVATEKAFSFPLERYDLVVCASTDRLLTGVELDDRWRLVRLLKTISATTEKVVIQTYFPEDQIWSMTRGDLRRFFADELIDRRRLALPPFGVIFEIIGHGSSRGELRLGAESVTKVLVAALDSISVSAPILISPSPNRHQAILTCSVRRLTKEQKKRIAEGLPPAWHLDIEPTS